MSYEIFVTDIMTGRVETVVYEVSERDLNDVVEEYELLYPSSNGYHLTVMEEEKV